MVPVRSPTFLPLTKRSYSDQMIIILFTSSCQKITFLAICIKYDKSTVNEDSVEVLVGMVADLLDRETYVYGLVFWDELLIGQSLRDSYVKFISLSYSTKFG